VKHVLLAALRFYKLRVSPGLPAACRYTPTCSEYAIEAVERYGAWRGSIMAIRRVLSCNPFARGGYDPVPQRLAR
jgi:putative membrane protein insertion efficiency factor